MSQVPFNINLEAPVKYVKHVEKLDTSVFPDCHTIERPWRILRGLTFERNMLYIHHPPECKWDILRIGGNTEIVVERLIK